MKIAIIGTVMRDEITTVRGEQRESFGGILYNTMALASMTRRSDEIRPVCYLGAEHLDTIRRRYFASHRQIITDSIRISPDGSDQNVLRYRSANDREEVMTINTPRLDTEHLREASDARAILVNFINGREISIESLRGLRLSTNAHLHLDVHNLGKSVDASGSLQPTGLANWRDWFSLVDTIQANEWEIELITGRKPQNEEEYRQGVVTLLSVPNVKAAALTIGGLGSILAHRMAPGGEPRIVRIPAMQTDEIVDTTGCGDCYSSAFVIEILRSGNPVRAALLATTLSGLNTLGGGLEDLAVRSQGLELAAFRSFPRLMGQAHDGYMGQPLEPGEMG